MPPREKTPLTIEEIEHLLGPSKEYVYDTSDLNLLRQWARSLGKPRPEIAIMDGVTLTNLYHEHGGISKDTRTAHDMLLQIMKAFSVPGFDVKLTQDIALETMRGEFDNWSKFAQAAVANAIEAMPPRVIHIERQGMPAITLPGPLHAMTEKVIRVAALGHPVMMVGPAGCGKTTIGKDVATALNLPFFITSTINDTHELTGFVDGYGKYHATPFRHAYQNGGVWVADEIDAWDASALLAANSALANGYTVFPDDPAPVLRNPNFRMIATANTFGNGADRVYIGRNELDAASLDRFATINVDYDTNLETMFAGHNREWLKHVWKTREKVNAKKIRHVVSTRAIIMGSIALSNGLSWNDVSEMYLLKGMSKIDRDKIKDED